MDTTGLHRAHGSHGNINVIAHWVQVGRNNCEKMLAVIFFFLFLATKFDKV